MSSKHFQKLISKAERDLQAEYTKWMEIIFGATIATMWQQYGWRKRRILKLIEAIKQAHGECSNDPDMSIIQMLNTEVGLEFRVMDEKSWKEYCILNADLRKKRTPAEYLHIKKKEKEWAHPTVLAMVILGLHRAERWGMLKRIPGFEEKLYKTCDDYQYNRQALMAQVYEYMDTTLQELVAEDE